jgi:hypothetical protein
MKSEFPDGVKTEPRETRNEIANKVKTEPNLGDFHGQANAEWMHG